MSNVNSYSFGSSAEVSFITVPDLGFSCELSGEKVRATIAVTGQVSGDIKLEIEAIGNLQLHLLMVLDL